MIFMKYFEETISSFRNKNLIPKIKYKTIRFYLVFFDFFFFKTIFGLKKN